MKDETLKTVFQSWDVLSATQEEVLAYEARLKQVLDEEATKREAELREQEAREEGKQEERKATVKRMKQKGANSEMIADFVGISVEEVEAILREWEQSEN